MGVISDAICRISINQQLIAETSTWHSRLLLKCENKKRQNGGKRFLLTRHYKPLRTGKRDMLCYIFWQFATFQQNIAVLARRDSVKFCTVLRAIGWHALDLQLCYTTVCMRTHARSLVILSPLYTLGLFRAWALKRT